MNRLRVLSICMALAAIAPLFAPRAAVAPGATRVPPWPEEFQGRPLTAVALSSQERRYLGDFPGAVARFTDGNNDIVMRWVTQPTRKLHPAEDCYRGWGFTVTPARIRNDRDASKWRCFGAHRGDDHREVCEQLRDIDGTHFTDVSSWYWSATLRGSSGPWLVTTVASHSAL